MNVKKLSSILLAGVLCLSPFGIQASTTYATSEDGSKNYTSIDDAWSAAQDGTKIIMSSDWNISSRLVLDNNKSATIEMNGHKISRGLTSSKTNGEVFKLNKKSTLTLNGNNASNTSFTLNGYNESGSESVNIQSGGLVTGGYSTNGAGAIHMKAGSSLNLNSVAVSGNAAKKSLGSDGHGGAVFMDGDSDSLTLNNAQISYNRAEVNGGGVAINNDKSSITLNNASSIDHNYAGIYGGGIHSDGKETKINLNASSISYNTSKDCGGGIYFEYSKFEVTSTNKDGQIANNSTYDGSDSYYSYKGGGIYAAQCVFSSNQSSIDGIKFSANSAKCGGAIYVNQENMTVSNCIFTENSTDNGEGGAIYVCNDGFVLKDSTIQNNKTGYTSSGALEVNSYNDVTFEGVINITNNTNTIDNTDADVCLDFVTVSKSYILSVPDLSSRIGLVLNNERTIAKNQTNEAMNIYSANGTTTYGLRYNADSNTIESEEITLASNPMFDTSQASDENTESKQEETQSYTITINMVNEAGTWQNTNKTSVNADQPFELQAPTVEDKTFVEFKDVPETLKVEDNAIKSDSISEDIELTLVYSDEESENLETGSIFGDGNTIVAAVIIVTILALGTFIFMKKKKSS